MPANSGTERVIGTQQFKSKPEFTRMFFADLVVIARSPEPDPIPNSTVKLLCADGTKSQGLGE